MVGRFSRTAAAHLKNKPITGLFCHSNFYGKKVKDIEGFSWEGTSLEELVGDALYPKREAQPNDTH
jgi:hypothetical protein